ncbi:MAG: LysM peptidoglycan-binding domain-containing protein [Chitinophagales bacterium]
MWSLDLQRFAADASANSGHTRRKRASSAAGAAATVYPLRRARAKAASRRPASRRRAVPGRPATVAPSVLTPPPARTAKYVVQPGDTLHRISNRFGTTARLLAALNGLHKPALLVPGEVILVPDPPPPGERHPGSEFEL